MNLRMISAADVPPIGGIPPWFFAPLGGPRSSKLLAQLGATEVNLGL